MHAELMAEDIAVLRDTIRANDGANVATRTFVRKVDELISAFYDDVEELTALSLADILDLFLIKVLYINRASRDIAAMEYLRDLLSRYLFASSMNLGHGVVPYMSDLVTATATTRGDETFEVARHYGDNALFISGVFPQSLGRKRAGGRMGGTPFVDRQYFITVGRQYYTLAANQERARVVSLRATLLRLSQFFDVYVDALNEMSGQYVMGMDMRLIADKMLDAFNRYRETKDGRDLEVARLYATLMKLDGHTWPELLQGQAEQPTYW
jgi:hypothetical protein